MIVSHPYRLLAVIAAALAMVVAGCSSSDSTGAGGDGGSEAVSVYPSPGTEVASHGSQISMVGIDPDDIGEITVVGSESGEHAGSVAVSYTHLRAHETVLDLVCRLLL